MRLRARLDGGGYVAEYLARFGSSGPVMVPGACSRSLPSRRSRPWLLEEGQPTNDRGKQLADIFLNDHARWRGLPAATA